MDTNTISNERFDLQLIEADPISRTPANWRVTDTRSNSRVATCFDSDNARMVRDALNAYMVEEESVDRVCKEEDGCPTEKSVLQRYWRETRPMLGIGLASPSETSELPAWDSPESVVGMILGNYQRHQSLERLRESMLLLVREAYEQGQKSVRSAEEPPCAHLEILTDHEGTCRKCGVRTSPSGMLPDNRPEKASARPVPACGNPVMVTAERYRGCVLPSGYDGDCSAQKASGAYELALAGKRREPNK